MRIRKLRVKLFWKILLLFWLAFVTVFTFNVLFTHLNSDNIRYRKVPHHLHKQLKDAKHKLKFILKKHPKIRWSSLPLLRQWYLLDNNGVDYSGKQVPEMLSQLNGRVVSKKKLLTAFRKQQLYFGGITFNIKEKQYKLYIGQQLSIFSRGYFGVFIREFAQNLLISIFLVSFPLSFLFAWLFTRPIKKLQLAVYEMSKDLSNRENLNIVINRTDEFGELAQDFNSMAIHLEKLLTSKHRLLSDVSHELRSPLARLQIAVGLANKKQNADSAELTRIKLEADRMNQMISGLLDYSKIEIHYADQDKQKFNLTKIVKMIIDDGSFESQQKGIAIKSKLQSELYINGIKPMIVSCIDNIIRNAIRYANSEVSVDCSLDRSSKRVVISISDNGRGIAEDQTDKIFEAFYRPDLDRSRQSGGVGLGLSIAKKVVEVHGGSIFAENIKPHGLKISIFIPR